LFDNSTEDHKHSIILVEEDIEVSHILAGHFVLANFRVYKTSSAPECLDKLKELESKVDAVLINGSIAADRVPILIVNIKKLNLKIQIFALTENENNKTRILDYGADEFAVKPISPITTVEKVSALLMKKPAEAEG
jgi:DNA-binding response OmpR family regulator